MQFLLLIQRHVFASVVCIMRWHLLWWRGDTQFNWWWQLDRLCLSCFPGFLLTMQTTKYKTQYDDEYRKTSYDASSNCADSALVRATRSCAGA